MQRAHAYIRRIKSRIFAFASAVVLTCTLAVQTAAQVPSSNLGCGPNGCRIDNGVAILAETAEPGVSATIVDGASTRTYPNSVRGTAFGGAPVESVDAATASSLAEDVAKANAPPPGAESFGPEDPSIAAPVQQASEASEPAAVSAAHAAPHTSNTIADGSVAIAKIDRETIAVFDEEQASPTTAHILDGTLATTRKKPPADVTTIELEIPEDTVAATDMAGETANEAAAVAAAGAAQVPNAIATGAIQPAGTAFSALELAASTETTAQINGRAVSVPLTKLPAEEETVSAGVDAILKDAGSEKTTNKPASEDLDASVALALRPSQKPDGAGQ